MTTDPIPDLLPLAPGEALAAVRKAAHLAPLAGACTVRELIAWLQALDPDTVVVLAKDTRGNIYSPVDRLIAGLYSPDNAWNGRFTAHGEPARGVVQCPAVCLEPRN